MNLLKDIVHKPEVQRLVRKGYLDSEGGATFLGTTLYNQLLQEDDSSPKEALTKAKESVLTGFEKWWSIFPSHDSFIHKGQSFGKTRGLRADKKTCEKLFNDLINKGKYTAEQIIRGTENDVNLKKDLSAKTRSNKLSYLQNSATYLRQESFEPHLDTETERIVNIPAAPKESTSVVDI